MYHKCLRALLPLALIGLFVCLPAQAQLAKDETKAAPSFWKVSGKKSTLWLFGSVHVLTKDHYPLEPKVEEAFAQSPNLVVEVDVLNTDPMTTQQLVMSKGSFPEGSTMRSFLGAERFAKANELAMPAGYNLELMKGMRPWLAAMAITMQEFAKLGYTADQGVDLYFLQRAQTKDIIELETLEAQLNLFAEMEKEMEVAALMQTLEQLQDIKKQVRDLITAWESGQLTQLEDTLLGSFEDYPQLYERIVTSRNKSWVQDLKPMLEQSEEDHFVVVGALHLVGEKGVVALLRDAGYEVVKQ